MMNRSSRHAFSLVEVLLALAIAVLLSAAILALLLNLGRRRTAILRLASEQQSTGVFLDRLEADLSAALAGDAALGAGVKGSRTELALLSRGVVLGGAGPAIAALGDLQGSRYVFDREVGVLKARRWSAGRGAAETGELEVVSSPVRRLRFRYFDGREWKNGFDSLAAGGLPVAVECAVWTGTPPASDAPVGDWGAPDRLRVIVVPDGPSAPWKEGQ